MKYASTIESPIGIITILVEDDFVYAVTFSEKDIDGLSENEFSEVQELMKNKNVTVYVSDPENKELTLSTVQAIKDK